MPLSHDDPATISSVADDLIDRLPLFKDGHVLDDILKLKLEAVGKLGNLLDKARGTDKAEFVRTTILGQLEEVDAYVTKAGSPEALVKGVSIMRQKAEAVDVPSMAMKP